jgi:hypothetical protein
MTDAKLLEEGLTISVRHCAVEGMDLVTVFYDFHFCKRMADYRRHREIKPVQGANLAHYAEHCNRVQKPVDAGVVGPSADLYVLHKLEGLRVENLPPVVVVSEQYGHRNVYN